MVHQVLVQVLIAGVEMRMVNDLIPISLFQFSTGVLTCCIIIQMAIHLCIAIQKMTHPANVRYRIEDYMILTTTDAEHNGGKEVHKALVQMTDTAVPVNDCYVLWRHATLEETITDLIATAVVLEANCKKTFAIVAVFHLTTETACHVSRYSTLTQVLPECRMAQRLFHNISERIVLHLFSLIHSLLTMWKQCWEAATKSFRNELGLCHELITVDELPGKIEDVATLANTVIIPLSDNTRREGLRSLRYGA